LPRPDYATLHAIEWDLDFIEAKLARVAHIPVPMGITRSGVSCAGTGHRYADKNLRKSHRVRGAFRPKVKLPSGCVRGRGEAPRKPGVSVRKSRKLQHAACNCGHC